MTLSPVDLLVEGYSIETVVTTHLAENITKKEKYITPVLSELGIPEDEHDDYIKWLSDTDPVSRKSKGKKTPYVNLVIEWLKNGSIKFPEDVDTTHNAMNKYLKNHKKIPDLKNTPITDYDSPGKAMKAIDAYVSDGPDDDQGLKYDNLAEKVGSENGYTMYRIDNYDQGRVCFADSGWCVQDELYFDDYGPPYFMITRGNKRVALLHADSMQAMDVHDNPLTYEVVKPFEKLFNQVMFAELNNNEMKTTSWYHQFFDDFLEGVEGPWPPIEHIIAQIPEVAIKYAGSSLKGRFLAAEEHIFAPGSDRQVKYLRSLTEPSSFYGDMSNMKHSKIEDVFGDDLPRVTDLVDASTWVDFGKYYGRFPAVIEEKIFAEAEMHDLIFYAAEVAGYRLPEVEQRLLGYDGDPYDQSRFIVEYNKRVMKRRWPAAERLLSEIAHEPDEERWYGAIMDYMIARGLAPDNHTDAMKLAVDFATHYEMSAAPWKQKSVNSVAWEED